VTDRPATTPDRLLRALFGAYLAATAAHIALVVANEPFAFDAWNIAVDTHAEPFSLGRWIEYGAFEYQHSNPRIGQWLTYLAYKLACFAPIATPIAYLGLALAVAVLGLGRWPGGRRAEGPPTLTRDLGMVAIAVGAAWFALPHIGMIMFCRAYCANYLYGAAIQLWFLVPLRLAPDRAVTMRTAVAYGALGVVAGMCNEHTGPTLIAGLVVFALWRRRAIGRIPRLVAAAAIGAGAGFAAIFFAPGQSSRYDGLATKVSLLGRLIQRGFTGNLDILRDWVLACAPVLALAMIALVVARRALRSPASSALDEPLRLFGLALAAGTLIAITVFVSPKLGPRFYLHGGALVLAGLIALADHALPTPRRLAPLIALAVVASAFAAARSLPLYLRLSEQSRDRLAALAAAPRGSVFTADSFEQVDDTWWFLGDDFRDIKKRELVASYFGLGGVIFRAVDLEAPLAVSDVRLVPRYQVTPATCLDEHGGLELGNFRGIDLASVHAAAQAAIARARERIAAVGRLDRLDLVVDFVGSPPPLPRPTLLVGRWTPAGYEGHTAVIQRRGASTVREVVLPRELVGTDAEIYAYEVSGEARRLGTARDRELTYVPWRHGGYWALACYPTECFVIAAARVL
jgi:hypothetical protein